VKSHPAQIAQHWEAAESWVEAAKSYQNACQHFADQYAYLAALTQAERGLAVLQNVPDAASLRLPLLVMRMQLHQVLMKMEDWQADLEVCGELAAALDDEIAQLQILESRLSMLALQSDLPNLEKVAEKALVLAQKNGMQKAEASIRNIWGWHLSDVAGRPFDGLPHLEQAVDLARQIENLTLLYRSLCNLAFCQRTLGCCGDALSSARQALTLLPTSDEPHPAQADALREIAEAAGYLARWQEARHAMRQVVQLYEEIGDPWALGTALYNWGLFTSAMGQHTEAIAAMERLVQLGIEVSLPPDSEYGIIHRTGWAKALLDSGDLAGAEEIYRSLKLPATITGRARVDYANLGGAIALSKGDADSAMRILGPIVAEFQGTQVPHFMWTLLLHARAAHRAGDSQKALKSLAAAEKAFRQGDCIRLGRSLYFARYQITGDAEALTAAYSELQRQMDIFTDSDLRADFLEQVILNREILAAWKKKE
jgi:tetratricopeptide (TPR) repeat protein